MDKRKQEKARKGLKELLEANENPNLSDADFMELLSEIHQDVTGEGKK